MYKDYEILYKTKATVKNKSLAIVEYDSTSNKPFMVYGLNRETLEYELYSGENDLDFAIGVADNL